MDRLLRALSYIPVWSLGLLSWILGSIGFLSLGKKRRTAVANIVRALGCSKGNARKLALRSFVNAARVGLEVLRLPRLIPRIEEINDCIGADHLREAHAQGKGVLVVTSHTGNWEYTAARLGAFGFPSTIVVRYPSSPLARRLVHQTRTLSGLELIDRQKGLVAIRKALAAGKIVIIAVDQYTGKNAVTVNFFGRPTRTVRVAAVLAMKSGVPIVLASQWREGRRFILDLSAIPLIERSGDPDADLRTLTQEISARIETRIRKRPDQWLWMHRRWRER